MGWKVVDKYRLGYSVEKRAFYFYYRLEGESIVYQIYPSAMEFMALADMFRNEGPIQFNTDGKYFVTEAEEVGEEEANP
ncbi:MAG: hypothetical protein JSV86_04385 [Gemmatimonadota bacterium]|nr:MAG: hypothetical protein JSV86_04385 [Gemmatimonadota bacterium]